MASAVSTSTASGRTAVSLDQLNHAKELRRLQGVSEDLKALDLISLPAPDVDDRDLRRFISLAHLLVTENHDRVAVLEELVRRKLELIPRPARLLQHLECLSLAGVLPTARPPR